MTTARTVSSIGGAAIVGAAIGAGAMRAAAPTPATVPTVERSEPTPAPAPTAERSEPAARAEWVVGDSNGDGVVSFDDINATTANWGATGPAWPLRAARSVHALRQESIDQPERCVILCDAPQAAIVAALPKARIGGARF